MPATYVPGRNGPRVVATTSGATTTLNPADKSAKVTLTAGDLAAEINANTANGESARSVASHSSGDFYCEVTINQPNGIDDIAFGPCNATFNVTNTAFSTVNAAGYFSDGNIYGNTGGGSVLNTGVTYTIGDVIGCEVDKTNTQFRVRKNGGAFSSWANCSFITGDWYFGVNVFKNGADTLTAKCTVNFGATAYGTAAPGGSSNW